MVSLIMLDNDIVFKVSCYNLVSQTVGGLFSGVDTLAVLGAAPFVISKRMKRSSRIADKEMAAQHLRHFLTHVKSLEPDNDEIELAAIFEARAQALGLEFDSGESLLFAMVVRRQALAMLTGDKRAILALEAVIAECSEELEAGAGKVACLEQLLLSLSRLYDKSELRRLVCAEPAVDRAAAIGFACASPDNEAAPEEGLRSYVEHLRQNAPNVLHARDDLSVLLSKENGVGRPEASH